MVRTRENTISCDLILSSANSNVSQNKDMEKQADFTFFSLLPDSLRYVSEGVNSCAPNRFLVGLQ